MAADTPITEPRLMTITEVEEKLAAIDAAHEKAIKEQEDMFANEWRVELARLARIRKAERADLVAIHRAKRATLATCLDVLRMGAAEK